MKKFGGILVVLFLALAVLPAPMAGAAACSNVSSFGAVTLTIPKLPDLEDRIVWVRLEAPASDSQVLVQINEDECLPVGGFEQPTGQWTWQASRTGVIVTPVVFPRAEGNTLKVIGIHDGVRVDRIVITSSNCVPQDFGENCQSVTALREDKKDASVQLPSPAAEAVRGAVLLSITPDKFKDDLTSVAYVVDGRTVQEAKSPTPFDTTLIANGKHTVHIVTTLQDGRVFREETVIDVDNAENVFSPLVRWSKLNAGTIYRVGVVLGLVIILLIGARILRKRRRTRRERRFHGF